MSPRRGNPDVREHVVGIASALLKSGTARRLGQSYPCGAGITGQGVDERCDRRAYQLLRLRGRRGDGLTHATDELFEPLVVDSEQKALDVSEAFVEVAVVELSEGTHAAHAHPGPALIAPQLPGGLDQPAAALSLALVGTAPLVRAPLCRVLVHRSPS